MSRRIVFFAPLVVGLLLAIDGLKSHSHAQTDNRLIKATAVKESDPIFPVLEARKAAIAKPYEEGKLAQPVFTRWAQVDSPTVAQLFPKLRFASISYDLRPHPESNGRVSLAGGLGMTLAIDRATHRLEREFPTTGNYEAYGKLLVDLQIPIRNAADAKLVWDAFCDIHGRGSKSAEIKKVSAAEWHLGISRYDQTISVTEGIRTDVTRTHFMKVLVDEKTGHVALWESNVETSPERKTPAK
jgi:hypothetical protein